MMTATWGGGANSPVAATGNLDDFGKGGAGTNSLIRHDIIRGIDILLLISEYSAIVSSKENYSREIPLVRFGRSDSAARPLCPVLSAPKPRRRSKRRSPSG
jgi:hypothetical protein